MNSDEVKFTQEAGAPITINLPEVMPGKVSAVIVVGLEKKRNKYQ